MSNNNGFLAPGMLKKYWLTLFATFSNAVFLITQFSSMFYTQFQEIFNLTNTQIGLLEGIGNIGGFVGTFIGGLLADRISPRKLVAGGCIVCGVASLLEAFTHSYFLLVIIYIAISFCSYLACLTPYFKMIKLLGSDSEQGKIMTFSESAYAAVTLLINYGFLALLEAIGLSFQGCLIAVGIVCIGIGVGIFAFFKSPGLTEEEKRIKDLRKNKTEKVKKTNEVKGYIPEFIAIFKSPVLYLSIIITFSMTFFNEVVYRLMNPFLTNVLLVSTGLASFIVITSKNALRIIVSPFGGTLRDKFNDSNGIIKIMCIALAVVFVLLAYFGGSSLIVYLALTILAGICIFAVTGLQYTLVTDAKVPAKYIGRMWGIVLSFQSIVTIVRGAICGRILDTKGYVEGFVGVYWVGFASAVLCAVAAILLSIAIKKNRAVCKEIRDEIAATEAAETATV